jgi:hypothetical protein
MKAESARFHTAVQALAALDSDHGKASFRFTLRSGRSPRLEG